MLPGLSRTVKTFAHSRVVLAVLAATGALLVPALLSAEAFGTAPLTPAERTVSLGADGSLRTSSGKRIGQVTDTASGQVLSVRVISAESPGCDTLTQTAITVPATVNGKSLTSSVSSLLAEPKLTVIPDRSLVTVSGRRCLTAESDTRLILSFPSGSFAVPAILGLAGTVGALPLTLLGGALAAFLAFTFVISSALTRLNIPIPKELRTSPPKDVTPIEFGLLMHGSIRSEDIVATIYDLVRRAHIRIIQQGSDTLIFRNREAETTDPLTLDEEILLTLLCPPSQSRASLSHALARLDADTFGKFIRTLYSQVYNRLQERGWITESVSAVRSRRKAIALTLEFCGVVLAAAGIFHPYPPLLGPLAIIGGGMFVAGLFWHAAAASSRSFSPDGLAVLGECISFSQYLRLAQPHPRSPSQSDILFSYYGYALAEKITAPWVNRFSTLTIIAPLWISSTENYFNGPAEFFSLVQGLLSSLGARFSRITDPNAD